MSALIAKVHEHRQVEVVLGREEHDRDALDGGKAVSDPAVHRDVYTMRFQDSCTALQPGFTSMACPWMGRSSLSLSLLKYIQRCLASSGSLRGTLAGRSRG